MEVEIIFAFKELGLSATTPRAAQLENFEERNEALHRSPRMRIEEEVCNTDEKIGRQTMFGLGNRAVSKLHKSMSIRLQNENSRPWKVGCHSTGTIELLVTQLYCQLYLVWKGFLS